MNIDWSKAPEGATHWEPASEHIIASWMKLEGETWFYWPPESDKPKWNRARRITGERADRMIPRPPDWNGEGLPPVGIECEVKNDINDGWDRVDEVLAHTTIKGAVVAVFKRDDRVFYSPADAFRPIRTPEQIAAEEQESEVQHVINQMAQVAGAQSYSDEQVAIIERLARAGYRKQEQK